MGGGREARVTSSSANSQARTYTAADGVSLRDGCISGWHHIKLGNRTWDRGAAMDLAYIYVLMHVLPAGYEYVVLH